MPEPLPEPVPAAAKSAWPKAVALIAIVALLVGGAVYLARAARQAPAAIFEQAGNFVKQGGQQLRSLAQTFQQGTVTTSFLSHATELTGTSRFQFATLKQNEIFKREEAGTTAWGWIPLPRVVVEAQAPVEYNYALDFAAPWQFERDGDTLRVLAPPIEPATPALDVSALSFYTLEGSVWRDEAAVKERLRESLTAALKERATENTRLVREIGRQRLAEFVEKWLAEKFGDGGSFRVKVIFPDELPATAAESSRL